MDLVLAPVLEVGNGVIVGFSGIFDDEEPMPGDHRIYLGYTEAQGSCNQAATAETTHRASKYGWPGIFGIRRTVLAWLL